MRDGAVLLYGTMADIGPVAAENLRGHGVEVSLVDFPQNRFRDFWGYGRGLGKAISAFGPGLIIPVGDALALSKLKPSLPRGVKAAVDDEEKIALLSSKVQSVLLADKLGVTQPRLFSLDEVGEVDQVIFKDDVSFGGSGVHRPRNLESLKNLVAHQGDRPYLIEEYIDGQDLSVDCIRTENYFRTGCYVSLGRKQTQGPSAIRKAVDCPAAARAARRILDYLDYRGVCGMDFRMDARGDIFFLECNPRLTGGLTTQIEAGFEIPWEIFLNY